MPMAADSDKALELLKGGLSGGRTSKILRFLLNVLSSTPIFGGVFSATAAASSERDQADVSQMITQLLQITDDKVDEVRNALKARLTLQSTFRGRMVVTSLVITAAGR